jgi:D-arabinose 1-dehydrogenase-like Zn-dependent alcohol dehydrogenase
MPVLSEILAANNLAAADACCLLLLLQVGLGGLGHMAVKFGVAFGCEVYVISRWGSAEC